jgi:hypothetical protein
MVRLVDPLHRLRELILVIGAGLQVTDDVPVTAPVDAEPAAAGPAAAGPAAGEPAVAVTAELAIPSSGAQDAAPAVPTILASEGRFSTSIIRSYTNE